MNSSSLAEASSISRVVIAVAVAVTATNLTKSRGVTTLTNAVSGQSQNCSGNLEISSGIGTLRNFSGKHAIVPGHCRKKILEFMSRILKISGKVTQKFGRMIQISGTTHVKTQ